MNNIGSGYLMYNDNRVLLDGGKVICNGNLGYGLKFNPSNLNYTKIPYNIAFEQTGSYSVSIFFLLNAYSSTNGYTALFSNYNEPFRGLLLAVLNDGRLYIITTNETFSVNKLNINRLHHVLITFDTVTSKMSIYINGNLDSIQPCNNTVLSSHGIYIGNESDVVSAHLDGYVMGASYFNDYLTNSEIKYLINYEGSIPPSAASKCIVDLKLNNRSGTTITDDSGNGFNGSLINYPAGTTDIGPTNSWIDAYTLAPIER
jgi:hypothetical protein